MCSQKLMDEWTSPLRGGTTECVDLFVLTIELPELLFRTFTYSPSPELVHLFKLEQRKNLSLWLSKHNGLFSK